MPENEKTLEHPPMGAAVEAGEGGNPSVTPPPLKPKQISQGAEDEIALFGNRVGGWVLGVCAALVAALVFLLHIQTQSLNADPAMISIQNCDVYHPNGQCLTTRSMIMELEASDIPADKAALIALEYDAQFLRTKRAQSLVSSRLFIQAIALLAGVSQITMGAAFIFARIRSSNASEASAEWTEKQKIVLKSLYPGVILCGFGVVIILGALWASDRTKFTTTDLPVYVEWPEGLSEHMKQESARKLAAEILDNVCKDKNSQVCKAVTNQRSGEGQDKTSKPDPKGDLGDQVDCELDPTLEKCKTKDTPETPPVTDAPVDDPQPEEPVGDTATTDTPGQPQ